MVDAAVAASHDYAFADAVELTDGDETTTVRAVVHPPRTEDRTTAGVVDSVSLRRIRLIGRPDLPRAATIRIDDETYTVDVVHRRGGLGVIADLIRRDRVETARPRYRRD